MRTGIIKEGYLFKLKHMKYILIAIAFVASSTSFGVAHAQNLVGGVGVKIHADANVGGLVQSSSSIRGEESDRNNQNDSESLSGEDSMNASISNGNKDENESEASTSENNKKHGLSGEHRSVVANFVHSLLSVADREGGIGAEVRAIAHTEDESATTTATAMAKVDDRGGIRTFFFGSDYKNLGVIRSEIATTTNTIARLEALLAKTTDATDRATITAQINALQDEQIKINAYVNAHEKTFSLFGWFTKIFVK